MLQRVQSITSQDFSKGLNTIADIFKVGRDQSPNLMNVKVNFDGSIEKRLGSSTTNSVVLASAGTQGFSNGTNSLSNNLVAWWKMDEKSGTRRDNWRTNHLTEISSSGLLSNSAGTLGNAAFFIAANSQGLTRASSSSLAMADSDFTISCWFYLTTTGERTLIAKRQSASTYEYCLFVNTDNVVTWRVSSSGSAENGTVRATSIGAVSTATWYYVTAWHDTGDTLGVSINLSADTATYASGVIAGTGNFFIGMFSGATADQRMNGRIDEVGFWNRVLTAAERSALYNSGTGNRPLLAYDQWPWASFDFGASDIRWLTVAAGTGIYASSNMGITFVNIATDRTSGYQYFERSKNVLISCSDSYDENLFWAGSAGTQMGLLNNSAPLARYAVNFQGYLILLNTNTRKRGFYYEDENTQLTGDWADSFDLPSSQDDEITGATILRKKLYVSTKYKLFRVTFVGGNPDWSYLEIKDWGYVPRTMEKVSLPEIGEVIVGMSWDRRLRLFDGADDRIVSDNIENDNGMCDFAMEKVSYAGSGLTTCFSERDTNEEVYKLCVPIGASTTETTHFINLDARSLAFYPDSNRRFQTMVMTESSNRRFLMAADKSGRVYILNSGNQDQGVTAIDDVFDSSFLFQNSPSQSHKAQKIDLYFSVTSSNRLYLYDRTDFSNTFKLRDSFTVLNTESINQVVKSIDIPISFNVYQYRISSSSGTNDPWRLNRADYFVSPAGIGRQ